MRSKRSPLLVVVAVFAAALALWLARPSATKPPQDVFRAAPEHVATQHAHAPTSLPQTAPENDASVDLAALTEPEPEITAVAAPAAPKVHDVLVNATYGPAPHQLSIRRPAPGFDGDIYPPQGFTPTPDGKLIVVDSAKKRLVWFGTDGRMERAFQLPPELLLPADVAVADDGTIVVVDTEGVETSGVVMLDPDGTVKARLPQMAGGMMIDMYTVGNDIYFTVDLATIKAGDTTGSASHETPGLFDQDGVIPGDVAPDGRTIVHASIHDRDAGQLLVSVITGEPPEHVFSRLYALGEPLRAIAYSQSDSRGTIYVAVQLRGRRTLLCFDLSTGEPLGHVLLPLNEGEGTPFSDYSVVESGGVIVQQLQANGVAYHFVDCRPPAGAP